MAEPQALSPLLPTKIIHQFPLPTWIENLAVRSNGQLLVTLLTSPDLYLIDPTTSPARATVVHTFPDYMSVTGIIELETDVFSVCTGNFNASTNKNEPGSFAVWEVDVRRFDSGEGAKAKKIVELKESGLLNGMELFSVANREVLIADSEVGCVWKVNVATGSYSKIIQVPEMEIPVQGFPMGINGLKLRDNVLYWTNTGRMQFCRVSIDAEAKAVGEVEVVAENIVSDDFVLDGEGNAWVTTNPLNTVVVVRKAGAMVLVAGNKDELEVAGGTACQFGRKKGEEYVLYVTTAGALAAPVKGSIVEGGKVVAIDTTKFYS